jgi:hypothetical protein
VKTYGGFADANGREYRYGHSVLIALRELRSLEKPEEQRRLSIVVANASDVVGRSLEFKTAMQ